MTENWYPHLKKKENTKIPASEMWFIKRVFVYYIFNIQRTLPKFFKEDAYVIVWSIKVYIIVNDALIWEYEKKNIPVNIATLSE